MTFIYMLRIAGQKAGLLWLKFIVDTHGWPGGVGHYHYHCHFHCHANVDKYNIFLLGSSHSV